MRALKKKTLFYVGAVGLAVTAAAVLAYFWLVRGTRAGALRAAWDLYLGQVLKVALTIALLVTAFRSPGIVPAALLAGYAASFVGYWTAPRAPRKG